MKSSDITCVVVEIFARAMKRFLDKETEIGSQCDTIGFVESIELRMGRTNHKHGPEMRVLV